ncbi:contact-dependent growth inhibition system immunity protein [Paenibacillus hunanensis]|uniref:contact-dependent growth inhibition system immunity protein n=1 Tax=Paenibacillus hunanensis TaxID=539262 RepID=UPI002A6A9C75|nr:contact-dependent growth inhibition system immunity protein [Paenibacillus hunanensis]WPP42431.1 contact-dependent growth inhibition system immunity protein [Paenibacillus hunanensis]
MDYAKNNLTVRKLRQLQGDIAEVVSDDIAPLSVWYARIQDIRLVDLDDGNIAKLIRQNLILEFAIPEAIQRLNQSPTAGGIYVGELMNSFNSIKRTFWIQNVIFTKESYAFLKNLKNHPLLIHFEWELEEEKQDYFRDLETMISKLEEVMKQI